MPGQRTKRNSWNWKWLRSKVSVEQPETSALGFPALGLKPDIVIMIQTWNNFVFKKQNWLHVNGLRSRGRKGGMLCLIKEPNCPMTWPTSDPHSPGDRRVWSTFSGLWKAKPSCASYIFASYSQYYMLNTLPKVSMPRKPEGFTNPYAWKSTKTQILCCDLWIMLNHYFLMWCFIRVTIAVFKSIGQNANARGIFISPLRTNFRRFPRHLHLFWVTGYMLCCVRLPKIRGSLCSVGPPRH